MAIILQRKQLFSTLKQDWKSTASLTAEVNFFLKKQIEIVSCYYINCLQHYGPLSCLDDPYNSLFRNKKFLLDEIVKWYASIHIKESFKNLVAHYMLHAVTLGSAIVLQMQMFYLHHCFKKKREGWKSNRNCSTSILLNCYEKREKKNCSKMKTQRGPYKIILCISLQHLLVVNGSKLVIVVKFVWTFWIIRL